MTTAEDDRTTSGNTNTEVEQKKEWRARAFLFTINQVELFNFFHMHFKNLKSCDYCIAAKEKAPTTGHEHIHMYVHFTSSYKLPKAIVNLKQHIDICRGSPKQNIDYVSKDGDIILQWGDEPHQGQLTYRDLKEMDMDETPAPYIRIKRQIDSEQKDLRVFRDMLQKLKDNDLKPPEVIYLTGPPDIGKTSGAYKYAMKKYAIEDIGKLTLKNGFIDVLNTEAKCFVIEEFRPDEIKAADFLQLTDRYGYRCNIKGGFCTLKPEAIYIASVKKPTEIYQDEANKQFMRRITKVVDLGAVDDYC